MTDLKITQQTIENQQTLLIVEVPDERVEKAMRQEARKLAKQVRIPGFRPGKAPYHVVVGRFGREAILEEVADNIGQDVYKEALDTVDMDPFGPAELKEITFDPLTYQIAIPMPPETDVGDYRNLRLPFEAPSEEAIDEAMREKIDEIREEHKTWMPAERAVAYGDLVTISIKANVGEAVILDNDDWDVVPDEEDFTLAPEFDAAFIGMTDGESKRFTIAFADDSSTPWPSQQGVFNVEVKAVKSEDLPLLDDDLALATGEYDTFEEFESAIRENVIRQLNSVAETTYHKKVVVALVEQATLAYPNVAIEQEISVVTSERENLYRMMYGIESTEEFLRMQGRTAEECREELRPTAKTRLERRLVLDAVAEVEQFPVSDYELDQFLVDAVGHDEEQLENLAEQLEASEPYRDYLTSLIQRSKAEDLVIEVAKGEEVPAPGEHVSEAPPPEPEEDPETETDDNDEQGAELSAETDGVSEDITYIAEKTNDIVQHAIHAESEATSQQEVETEATLEASEESEVSDDVPVQTHLQRIGQRQKGC